MHSPRRDPRPMMREFPWSLADIAAATDCIDLARVLVLVGVCSNVYSHSYLYSYRLHRSCAGICSCGRILILILTFILIPTAYLYAHQLYRPCAGTCSCGRTLVLILTFILILIATASSLRGCTQKHVTSWWHV